MPIIKKQPFPVGEIRRYLEPGPIVLVSSRWKDETNIMTMGWHTVMEFNPSLVGCVIAGGNHSFDLIRKSKQCVINLPTTKLTDIVIGIGNSSGSEIDKFEKFDLTAVDSEKIDAPSIGECHANFECRLHDGALIEKYNFFIFEVVAAHAARTPKNPETLHYKGEGAFMIAGENISRKARFLPDRL
ncbi:MAG: flavin reductase family protein [Caulobacterales bacterium]